MEFLEEKIFNVIKTPLCTFSGQLPLEVEQCCSLQSFDFVASNSLLSKHFRTTSLVFSSMKSMRKDLYLYITIRHFHGLTNERNKPNSRKVSLLISGISFQTNDPLVSTYINMCSSVKYGNVTIKQENKNDAQQNQT